MKGSSFERETSRLLSVWWTQGKRDDLIWRTNASGARATQRHKAGKDTKFQFGDLTFTDDEAKPLFERLSMELKTGYGTKTKNGISRWDVLDILDSKQKEPVFIKMWKQAERDAELSKREPVLIFRRNSKASCIAFRRLYLAQDLKDMCGGFSCSSIIIKVNESDLIILNLVDFLKWTENLPNVWRKK